MSSYPLNERIRALPLDPGVYLFKDSRSRVVYVGKASRLRNRVKSYFGSQSKFTPKVARLVEVIADLEFFVTGSEEEALVLELNLIKKFRPRFNIMLKDDKTFPYLKIDLADPYPRISITRRMVEDGGRYFGPFASAGSVRTMLGLIQRIFPFRSCTQPIDGRARRPCLDYHIKRCMGPCIGAVTREDYARMVRQVTLFLEGRLDSVLEDLRTEMEQAAEGLEFERAAAMRDQIGAVERVIQGQRIATAVRGDQDVIAFARSGDTATVEVFFIRNGKLTGRERFTLESTREEDPSRIMAVFVKQFYGSATSIPPVILLQHRAEDLETIQTWLSRKRGARVQVAVPTRGPRKALVDTVAENARQEQEHRRIRDMADSEALNLALEGLKQALSLPNLPRRIECYDISNTGGTHSVGSMVVFEHGKPARSQYRRFRIKTVSGPNDYAMMQEVLKRRFKRYAAGEQAEGDWAAAPDLVLIDGGKGHLAAAVEVLKAIGLAQLPVASLAKEHEEVFVPGAQAQAPLPLLKDAPALHLLQRVRDEAHRFAIGYHRNVRSKESRVSILDAIPGIGQRRRRALLKKFGSARAISEAPISEIEAVDGMNRVAAQKVKQYLQTLPV